MTKSTYYSLYHQLRRAKKLDELMLFLEDPSSPHPGTYRRCAKAEPMLAGWGFAHSPSTIWRLYRRHVLTWRMGMAQSEAKYTENPMNVEHEIRQMTKRRTYEFLANPNLDPRVLVTLARIELQKKVYRLNQKKFQAALRSQLDVCVDAIAEEIKGSSKAQAALKVFQEALAS